MFLYVAYVVYGVGCDLVDELCDGFWYPTGSGMEVVVTGCAGPQESKCSLQWQSCLCEFGDFLYCVFSSFKDFVGFF